MRSFTLVALAGVCVAKMTQVMVLMDVTQRGPLTTELPAMLSEAFAEMVSDGEHEFAIASFADKPAPYSGVGAYGDYAIGPYAMDYCYALEAAFTNDATELNKKLLNMSLYSGIDSWEAQFEAIIRGAVDETAGWRSSSEAHKIVLLVTDSFGHSLGADTLGEHVQAFNVPVRCHDKGSTTAGGFGAIQTAWSSSGWVYQLDKYEEYQQLLYKRSCVDDLTAEEEARFEELREVFPVRQYPSVKPFDMEELKKNPENHCAFHEYPFYDDVVDALKARDATLFVLFHNPSNVNPNAFSDEEVWTWALSDTWALANVANVWENIPDLKSIAATGKTDSPPTLEGILRSGFDALNKA